MTDQQTRPLYVICTPSDHLIGNRGHSRNFLKARSWVGKIWIADVSKILVHCLHHHLFNTIHLQKAAIGCIENIQLKSEHCINKTL